MKEKEEDVRVGANKFPERQPFGTSAQTDKDFKEPPHAPLLEPGELCSWPFWRGRISASKMKTPVIVLVLVLLLAHTLGASTLTIQSPDGDLIDCINRENQPAFRNPLLKDHIIQEYPTGMTKPEIETVSSWQVWHSAGITCPAGTIPIRRDSSTHAASFRTKSHPLTESVGGPTQGHMHALVFQENQKEIYGTRATLNVWDPIAESPGDFSLAQIWLAAGSYQTLDLITIEAGWTVYPSRYHDNQPRFFTYWTRDAYTDTGCYGTRCDGFVQISQTIALETAISRTSTLGDTQVDITIQIWKDSVTGNWWLGFGHNTEPVGYWPAALFTLLHNHATTVHWGGEVLYRNTSGLVTEAPMGSGQFADKGFRRAAYFCNLLVAKNKGGLLPVEEFDIRETNPKFYTVKKRENQECGRHFYFGGPGPQRSGVVHGTGAVTYYVILLCFLLILCV